MVNHDYVHCWDYEKGVCPENCFLAVLTEDLKNWPYPVTYAKIKGTDACPITNPPPKPTNYERIYHASVATTSTQQRDFRLNATARYTTVVTADKDTSVPSKGET